MKKLNRKLIKDFYASRGLFLAVAVVIFLGVMLFGASYLGYRNLKTSYDYSYETLSFADFTASVIEAPPETVGKLESSIQGIEAVTGRINTDLLLTIPGEDVKRIIVRALSLPPDSRPKVNDVKMEEGNYFNHDQGNVLLVEKSFAEHHEIHPEDTLSLKVNNENISFTVAGVVTSPEYIWPAKSRQEILSSFETFGVVFIPEDVMYSLTGETNLNEFCFLIEDGADRQIIIDEVEAYFSNNWKSTVTKEDQPSNMALTMDLEGFGEMAEIFPMLFLVVGALATYILLTRIVQNQRPQIGLMRAVGYSRRKILLHYLSFALIIGIIGSVLGITAGYFLSELITNFYVGILGLPYTEIHMGWMEWLAIEEGVMIGVIPCLIAGIIPALAASRLNPSEAMRTPPPTAGRRLLIERAFPFLSKMSSLWKIPIRNMFRNRRRSVYTLIGVAFGITLCLVSLAFIDSTEALFSLQYDKIQISDADIDFSQPVPVSQADDILAWEGVNRVEPTLQLPTMMISDGTSYSTMAVGLPPDSELYGLYNTNGDRVYVEEGKIQLSAPLKKTLDIDIGDIITLQMPPLPQQQLEIAGFVQQPMSSFGFISLSDAQSFIGGQNVITGIMLNADEDHLNDIRKQVNELPSGASITITSEAGEKMMEMMDLMYGMMWILFGFGAILALAIVFTTVMVSILERRREIAAMRTLGESQGRIAAMITIENLVLGIVGIIPGIPLAYLVASFMMRLYQSDMMDFSLIIFPKTYVFVVITVILIMLISQIPGIRNVNRMELAKVIKEQTT